MSVAFLHAAGMVNSNRIPMNFFRGLIGQPSRSDLIACKCFCAASSQQRNRGSSESRSRGVDAGQRIQNNEVVTACVLWGAALTASPTSTVPSSSIHHFTRIFRFGSLASRILGCSCHGRNEFATRKCVHMPAPLPTGKMIFTVLASVSELERSLIGERVRAGLRNAKARGTRLGRPPLKDPSVTETRRLRRERRRSRTSFKGLAEKYGVSVWTAFQLCKRASRE